MIMPCMLRCIRRVCACRGQSGAFKAAAESLEHETYCLCYVNRDCVTGTGQMSRTLQNSIPTVPAQSAARVITWTKKRSAYYLSSHIIAAASGVVKLLEYTETKFYKCLMFFCLLHLPHRLTVFGQIQYLKLIHWKPKFESISKGIAF